MADSVTARLRGLLATDVYSEKGRLRADDLLVRERVGRGLGEADALSGDVGRALVLDEIDMTAHETRLRKLREVIAERRRYLEILA